MLPGKDVMTQSTDQKHILAMNESDDVLELFRELLEEEGYRVTTQPYLDKDLQRIEAIAPDLILLDYMWAGDDSGWALLQMLRMNPGTSQIPMVLCTGAVKQVEALRAHLHEMQVRVILKPFNIDELTKEIAAELQTAPAPANASSAGASDAGSRAGNIACIREHDDSVMEA